MVQDAAGDAEVEALGGGLAQIADGVTAQEGAAAQAEQLLGHQALEKGRLIRLDRHDLAGAGLLGHVAMATLERTEVEDTHALDAAEALNPPVDAWIFEETRLSGS